MKCPRQRLRLCNIHMLLALTLATGQANAQDSMAIPDGLAPEYHRCHEVLWSEPVPTISDLAGKNSEKPATGLVGLRCTDSQIIENMVQKGWIYKTTNSTGFHTARGGSIVYNRSIGFCNPSRSFLDRLLWDCIQNGRFLLLHDRVQLIGAWGSL